MLLAPAAGLSGALLFHLTDLATVEASLHEGVLPAVLGLITGWSALHFRAYLRPFHRWLAAHPDASTAPAHLHHRLRRFSRDFWGLFLLYALAMPLVFFLSRDTLPDGQALGRFLDFLLLQLAAVALVGLPAYFLALDRLGRLASRLGLDRVQVSLKSKTLLLGGFVPLLCYGILVSFYWRDTGRLSADLLALWGTLAVITAAMTVLAMRSMAQALGPVQEVLGRSGASPHEDLARLRPQSTDEIGYLTQTLGRLFRRLGDQESHMRAVVDTAAEGIVVVTEQGEIDTFNPAAEQLFGYLATEIRGRPLSWLLPDLADEGLAPQVTSGEREVMGLHRNGRPIA
ncbi:MAG TPA: PAS domain S-box protein, partial [Gammaproteobacteria bacterium]|nr:PAS domain S-box protein [Gammaproteobacteria bacterium]